MTNQLLTARAAAPLAKYRRQIARATQRALFLGFAALVGASSNAGATVTIADSAPANPVTGYYQSSDAGGWQWKWSTNSGRRDVGQTFTAPQDFTLDKFAIRINNQVSDTTISATPFNYKLSTFATASTATPGALVASASDVLPEITSAVQLGAGKWLVFDVPNVVLTGGQVYGFTLGFIAAAPNRAVTFTTGVTNGYPAGNGIYSADGTTWSRQSSFEFQIYAAPPIALDLQTLIRNAITANPAAPTVTLANGTYKVTSNNTIIQNATNFTLDGGGATLIFPPTTGYAVAATGCNGVTLKNFKVDYDPLPFTQGTVTAISADSKQIDFSVHAGYPALDTFGTIKQAYAFDAATRNWKDGVGDMYPSSTTIISPTQGRLVFGNAPGGISHMQTGDFVVMTQRAGDALKFTSGCKNVTVQDVTVFTAPGCGFTGRYLSGTNSFTRAKIERGPLPTGATQARLISTGADGLHYGISRSGPTVSDCDFGWMGDDAVNLYGALMPVLRIDSPTVFWTVRLHAPDYTQYLPQANDIVRVLAPNNYAPKTSPVLQLFELGTYTPALTWAQITQIWPTGADATVTYYKVTVDSTAGMLAGDWVDMPSLNSPNFSIQNSYFHDHRARGLRIQASHGLIANNRLERIKASAMTFGPMYTYWREAGWVNDVTVTNNSILNVASNPDISATQSVNPGAISIFAQQDSSGYAVPAANAGLTFTGNTINGSNVAGIHVNAANGVSISGNTLSNCNKVNNATTGSANGLTSGYAICVNNSTGVTVGTNTFGTAGAYQVGNVQPF